MPSSETRKTLPPKVATLLQEYPTVITLPVQWGEQDLNQHVNNVVYLRYFESGRMAYFNDLANCLGMPDMKAMLEGKTVGTVLSKVVLDYRRPVAYPDTLTIGIKVDANSVRSDRFDQVCRIVSRATLVCFDHQTQRKVDLNQLEGLLEVIQQWEKGTSPVWNAASKL
ncbi:HotDog domain-containing protein, partial [Obelidium mucronatum]